MEDSIDTADSMRARGYGAAKRTTFSRFRFAAHDTVSLVLLLALTAASIFFITNGSDAMRFYPDIKGICLPGIILSRTPFCFVSHAYGTEERLKWL
jgi:energy-coupling factor transport system permease protein